MADRIDGYAEALFSVAHAEGVLPEVEDELFRFARTLEGNDELRTTLTDAAIPLERRRGVVEDILGPRASPTTSALVSFVVGAGRAADLPSIVNRLVARAATERDAEVAEVRSAIALDEATRGRLATALGNALGKTVEVRVIVDPTVIGGLVAQVGDTVIDGSVRHRLDQLREQI
jgi:F-type H+-transporting ATPase subunit delta